MVQKLTILREPLGLFTTHKTVVSHMFIHTSPIRSLLTICFDGVAAIHNLDEEVHKHPAVFNSPTRLNIASTLIGAEGDGPYFVIARRDGTLALFHLKPQNDAEGGTSSHIAMLPVRTISTGLLTIYRICVFNRGIIVGGFSRTGDLSFLYYDFAHEGTPNKT